MLSLLYKTIPMNVQALRDQFPILKQKVNKRPLVYFDNGATTQKPKVVIDAISTYYETVNANVHRGIHTLSQISTTQMEDARKKIQQFIHAAQDHEVIFTKGTTEGINLLAYSLRSQIKESDEIIVSYLEHHSNIVPWQMLCEATGASLKVIPLLADGQLDMKAFDGLLSDATRLVAVNHVSNALGIINPIEEIIAKAHEKGSWVLLDAAQSIAHSTIDVQALDVDFMVFSGHKMYGPTGTGILYGKENLLNELDPFHGGGEMIKEVSFEKTTYAELPFKFEAGTPNIAGNIALGVAVDFLQEIGMEAIAKHEKELLDYATEQISQFKEVEIYAKDVPRSGALSFNLKMKGVHPSDVGMILDKQGIAIRTGHHCAQPIMKCLGVPGTARASFAVYNTKEEIDVFVKALEMTISMLG